MRILKFGGSSLANPEAIKQVQAIVDAKRKQHRIIVVLSAFDGVTDTVARLVSEAATGQDFAGMLEKLESRHVSVIKKLLSVGKQTQALTRFKMIFNELEDVLTGVSLTRELTDRTRDFVLGFGERFSALIVSAYLTDSGIASTYIDARKVLQTDSSFGAGRIKTEPSNAKIRERINDIDAEVTPVITGFIASSSSGESTTLGRGGSDYTASLIGAALDAEAIELWSDIDGVMTADPRKVNRCYVIPRLSYDEAMELSHFGAKVVYPPTIQPAMKASIPISIKNTFKPDADGTTISSEPNTGDSNITGISSIDNISLLTIRGSGMIGVTGIASRVFGAMARAAVNIIMITQSSSEHTITLAVLPQHSERARQVIREEFKYELRDNMLQDIVVEDELSIVAVVGDRMRQKPGISGQVFQSLGRNGINVIAIAQGSSERNISIVVDRKDQAKTLNTLHDAFFMSHTKTVNLFLAGLGLIGNRLLELINEQAQNLLSDFQIELKLTGITNSRQSLVDPEGISIGNWSHRLQNDGQPADINRFVDQVADLNLSNSIFIDCTASEAVSEIYSKVLQSSISLVTANKKANSSSLEQYTKLQDLAHNHNVAYLYETNVGAGLPVIATLREQILTGDKLQRIEGVLSGTLSYIFNTYDGSTPFSEVVKNARDKGFTEPDPREDLNGRDIGRKLLILVREAGLRLEFDNIDIQNLVPEEARSVESVDEFFSILAERDAAFLDMYEQAQAAGKKLCYIARFEDGEASVGLEQIAPDHPFYNLDGSDNIVAFNTMHYQESPIVVKGPGAGADVTASGIIADILRIGNAPSFRRNW